MRWDVDLQPSASCPSGNDLSSVLNSLPPMVLFHHDSARTLSRTFSRFLALFSVVVIGTACSTTAPPGNILFEDSRGTVSLQTIADDSIQASHPAHLDPALLARVLQGIEVQDKELFGIQKIITGPSSPIPVFSDDQVQFLAPLLAEGLRRAAPDQTVEYRVQTMQTGSLLESSNTETTAGSLYAYGRQLYVTLSQYRSSTIRANQNAGRGTARPRPPDFSGLRDRTLLFTPKAAQRSDGFDPPTGAQPTDRFLAIDYELLRQASPATTTAERTVPQMDRRESPVGTGTPAASSQTRETLAEREAEIHTLKDLVNKNASEVETLRKELQSVQQQLGSQPTKPDSQKRKPLPPVGPQLPFAAPSK
jgi:hypothetical protein